MQKDARVSCSGGLTVATEAPAEAAFDPIASHNRVAPYYRFRTPYGADFFALLAEKAGLGPDSEVLDLCCGTGTVAAGLAPHCGRVEAIDGAPGMIEAAPRLDNITYRLADINVPGFADTLVGRQFDLVTIGMGIHWLDDAAITCLRRYLKPGSRIAILASGFSGSQRNPWFPEFQALRRQFAQAGAIGGDWTGVERMQAQGYLFSEHFEKTYGGQVGVKLLVNHLLSFALESEQVLRDYDSVLARMTRDLLPHIDNGKVQAFWTSSARLFADGPAG